jgi:NADH-quinone oxidoreductase subunit J
MTSDAILATVVVVLGAAGTYLMLPHRHGVTRPRTAFGAGAAAAALALLLFLTTWSPPGPFLPTFFFYLFAIAAIVGGLLTVTSRNPVYSALWFASVVLSTAGLFLLAGASFLAAGTVIVYAGAIIVTFLFVIMLAQMEGKADYDRAARAPGLATFTCYLLLWCLLSSLATVRPRSAGDPRSERGRLEPDKYLLRPHEIVRFYGLTTSPVVAVLDRTLTRTSQLEEAPGVEPPNVAGLGASLYTDHLVTVGLAGALLFVALISAVAIANPPRPGRAAARGPDPAQAAALAAPRGPVDSRSEAGGPGIRGANGPASS